MILFSAVALYLLSGYLVLLVGARKQFINLDRPNGAALLITIAVTVGWFFIFLYFFLLGVFVAPTRMLQPKQ